MDFEYDYDDPTPYCDDHEECDSCDGRGIIWNNADPTSGQWMECDKKAST
jgi:hypothetical protein